MSRVHSLAIVALTLAAAASAGAQSNVPGERFRPATTSAGIIDVEAGSVVDHLNWSAALWGGYALDPLVAFSGQTRLGAIVNHRVGANLVASLGLFDWIQLGVDMPLIVFQSAQQGSLDASLTDGLAVAGLGDLRLVPKIRLLRASEQLVDLAIIPTITLPTGFPSGQSFTGEGQLTLQPEVALSRQFDDGLFSGLKVGANAMARIRPEERVVLSTPFGHELVTRLGVGYRFHDTAKLPLEIDVSTVLGTPLLTPFSASSTTSSELTGGVTYDVLRLAAAQGLGDAFVLQAFGGVAGGLTSGVGTPAMRVFIGVRGETPTDIDTDDDGVADINDKCPNEAEDKDGFDDADGCPDPDNDNDGVADVVDACPNDAEDADGFEDGDGCPDLDNDNDGVADDDDACRDTAGPKENAGCPWPDADNDGVFDKDDACKDVAGLATLKGCPDADGDGVADGDDACPTLAGPALPYKGCPDTDGDGFTDDVDKCPTEPETVNNVDDDDGCPDEGKVLVTLTREKIEILEVVFFDTAKATIKPKSFGLLDQVATVLRSHKELAKVRVEGHTDDEGSDDTNMALSQERAAAVKAYLVSKGIDASRLDSAGFGETRPAAEGTTASAREKNRRVEFVIVE